EKQRLGQTLEIDTGTPRKPEAPDHTVNLPAEGMATQQRGRPDATVEFSGAGPADGSDRTGAWDSSAGTQHVLAPSDRTGGWDATAGDSATGPAAPEKHGPAA